jgi:uncharacterized protein (DUF2147 family)
LAVHFGHREDNMTANFKTLLVTSAMLASFFAGLAGQASAAEPYGVWLRPSTGTQVHFYDCGGKLCGKIVAVKDQKRKSEIGTVIMKGAAKTGDNKWEGDLLDVDSGKIYSGVVRLEGPSALNLKGCFLVICKGETWRKVK